jgi:hypothetical protein
VPTGQISCSLLSELLPAFDLGRNRRRARLEVTPIYPREVVTDAFGRCVKGELLAVSSSIRECPEEPTPLTLLVPLGDRGIARGILSRGELWVEREHQRMPAMGLGLR